MALCQLALHLGQKMLKKLQTLEESSSFIWALFVATPSMSTSEEDTGWGSNEFFIKISAKTSLTPNYFLA